MQEQNFEKQVQHKMEELSLTPSEPVWKKIEEQVRKKRDRRRLFFWLPVIVLLCSGGLWLIAKNTNSNNTIATEKQEINKTQVIDLEPGKEINGEKEIEDEKQHKESIDIFEKEPALIKKETFNEKREAVNTPRQNLPLSNLQAKKTSTQKVIKSNASASRPGNIKTGSEENGLGKTNQAVFKNISGGTILSGNKEQTINKEQAGVSTSISDAQSVEHAVDDKLQQNGSAHTDTTGSIKAEEKTDKQDSLAIEKNVVTNRRSINTKWKFALEAGIAVSGVNNGIKLFGGGLKSMSSNAFARDQSLSFSSSPSNATQGSPYKPPSIQTKSTSFLIGALVKKQVSKRWFLSTGLQYNFYSTQMQVGQNVSRDTVVNGNKSVTNFYTNSDSGSNNYQNKFHFISLPVAFDFQLFNKLPLDLHIGLSVQQLVQTNALLYSSLSQVYYEDEKAFNKTYLFSHLGLEYSFSLNKKLSLKAGPRVNYSHSKVMKTSDRHLFSYGLITQLVFSGK